MHDADRVAAAFWERRRVSFILDGEGGAIVVNRDTGYRWQRGARHRAGLLWHQVSPRPAGASNQAARLIAHPDTTGEDLAGVLRMAMAEPWISLLRRAERIARQELGVDPGRIRQMHDLAHAVMAASEQLPHRVVLIVDDPAAVAAAYQADTALAGTHVEAAAYRYSSGTRAAAGERVLMTLPVPREQLISELLTMLENARPGQRFAVEPVAMADVR
jgi:hypothetical protein